MGCNPFKYCVFKQENFAEAEAEGYDLNVSKDGLWGVGDLGNQHVCDDCTTDLPAFATQEIIDNMAVNGYLDHEFATKLVSLPEWMPEDVI